MPRQSGIPLEDDGVEHDILPGVNEQYGGHVALLGITSLEVYGGKRVSMVLEMVHDALSPLRIFLQTHGIGYAQTVTLRMGRKAQQ